MLTNAEIRALRTNSEFQQVEIGKWKWLAKLKLAKTTWSWQFLGVCMPLFFGMFGFVGNILNCYLQILAMKWAKRPWSHFLLSRQTLTRLNLTGLNESTRWFWNPIKICAFSFMYNKIINWSCCNQILPSSQTLLKQSLVLSRAIYNWAAKHRRFATFSQASGRCIKAIFCKKVPPAL